MRRFAFVIALAGLLALALLLNVKSYDVNNSRDLELLEINQKIKTEGKVVDERALPSGNRILNLDNEIVLVCSCSKSFSGKFVIIEGFVSVFNEQKQVNVLKIWEDD